MRRKRAKITNKTAAEEFGKSEQKGPIQRNNC